MNNTKISAHGRTYETVAAANARIAFLSLQNMEIGLSDGRVTEINAILAAMVAIVQADLDQQEGNPLYKDVHGRTMASKHVELSLNLQSLGL